MTLWKVEQCHTRIAYVGLSASFSPFSVGINYSYYFNPSLGWQTIIRSSLTIAHHNFRPTLHLEIRRLSTNWHCRSSGVYFVMCIILHAKFMIMELWSICCCYKFIIEYPSLLSFSFLKWILCASKHDRDPGCVFIAFSWIFPRASVHSSH